MIAGRGREASGTLSICLLIWWTRARIRRAFTRNCVWLMAGRHVEPGNTDPEECQPHMTRDHIARYALGHSHQVLP